MIGGGLNMADTMILGSGGGQWLTILRRRKTAPLRHYPGKDTSGFKESMALHDLMHYTDQIPP